MRYEPNAKAVRNVVRPKYPIIMKGVYSPRSQVGSGSSNESRNAYLAEPA